MSVGMPSRSSTIIEWPLLSSSSSGSFFCSIRGVLDDDAVRTLRTHLEVLLKVTNLRWEAWEAWDGWDDCDPDD